MFRRHRLASILQASEITQAQSFQRPHSQQYITQGFESTLQRDDNAHAQFILDTYSMSCPSSWHATCDRHSPVLPNNHAAQKIFQRERQLYITDYRRKQYIEQNRALMTSLSSTNNFASRPIGFYEECQGGTPKEMLPCSNIHQQYSSLHQANILPYMDYNNDNMYSHYSPPFPDFNNKYGRCEFYPSDICFQPHYPANFFFEHGSKFENLEQMYGVPQRPKFQHHLQDFNYNSVQEKHCLVSPNVQNFYSSANLRFSVVCNSECEKDCRTQNKVSCSSKLHENVTSCEALKSENSYRTCCAKPETNVQKGKQPVKYDVEASIYMRIVEAQNTDNNSQFRKIPTCDNIEKQNVSFVT